MDLFDTLQALAQKIEKSREIIQNEEATKQAFTVPFINALGYDIFDPHEVVPEFTADVGTKKGERVDYAINIDGEPMILVECKWCGSELDLKHASQLFRYFSATTAKIGALTNGIIYRFFTDLEKQNQMDDRPFLEFNMLDFNESQVKELKKFSKSSFNIDEMLSTASDLKYTREIKAILNEQLINPDEEFTKFFVSKVYSGMKTKNVIAQFTDITKRAFSQFIKDQLNQRFQEAMNKESKETIDDGEGDSKQPEKETKLVKDGVFYSDDEVTTTQDEIEAYSIVKSILREVIDISRIFYRDKKTYFGILLDDNNRKPICRFILDNEQKYIVLFDKSESISKKVDEKLPISDLNEIYNYSDRIKNTLKIYEKEIVEAENNQ